MLTTMVIVCAAWCFFVLVQSLLKAIVENRKEVKPDGLKQLGMRSLQENGYDILKAESEAKYVGYIDKSAIKYQENAHFIARKDGAEYAVFVCIDMPSESEICTRYFPLFVMLGVHGLIFINLMDESIHHADFSLFPSRRYRMRQAMYRSLWFVGGLVFAFAWLHRV